MEAIAYIVLPILILLLAANILRWLMPAECYIWFRARYGKMELLLGLGVTTVVFFWGLTAGAMVWSLFTSSWEMWETIGILLYAAAVPLGLLAAKLLMKKFWKPTPEMLAFNNALMKAEMETAADSRNLYWVCTSCGKKNHIRHANCTHCGIAQLKNR